MIGPGNARELLLVEALGDVARLLDQVDGVTKSLNQARDDVERASARLQAQVGALEHRMALMTERAKAETVKHIVHHADQQARKVVGTQTQELEAAARTVFDEQLRATLLRLGQFIEARIAQRILRREWWISAAAGTSVVLLTHVATLYFFGR